MDDMLQMKSQMMAVGTGSDLQARLSSVSTMQICLHMSIGEINL